MDTITDNEIAEAEAMFDRYQGWLRQACLLQVLKQQRSVREAYKLIDFRADAPEFILSSREYRYRRGYQNGYGAALSDGEDASQDALQAFFRDRITPWAMTRSTTHEWPPEHSEGA